MRNLTLNEKITIKGLLAKKGVTGIEIAKLTMSSAVHYWHMLYGKSISYYAEYL